MADKTIGEMVSDKRMSAKVGALLAGDRAYNEDLIIAKVQGIRNGLRCNEITRTERIQSAWMDSRAKRDLEAMFAPKSEATAAETPEVSEDLINARAETLQAMACNEE